VFDLPLRSAARWTETGGVASHLAHKTYRGGSATSFTTAMGPLAADLRSDGIHILARRSEPVQSMSVTALSSLGASGEFVSVPLGGQVTGWVRRRWRLAKFSTSICCWLLHHNEPSDTDCATEGIWLPPLAQPAPLAGSHL